MTESGRVRTQDTVGSLREHSAFHFFNIVNEISLVYLYYNCEKD